MGAKAVVAYNGADAGLGNRVRVTIGAANLAVAEHRRFYYVWPQTPAFEPAFTDLWTWHAGRTVGRSLSRAMALLTGYMDHDLRDVRRLARRPVWQIRTGGPLLLPPDVKPWQETFRALVPTPAVADMTRSFFETHLAGRPYVGVQVRAHAVSHQVTKESSPVSWYVERMTDIVGAVPGTRFFISADVPDVKRDLVATFPGAVALMHDHPYNSRLAVQCAVADLYLLASANRLIGPHKSSFIEMAQYLTHPLVKAHKPKEPVPSDAWTDLPLANDPLSPGTR